MSAARAAGLALAAAVALPGNTASAATAPGAPPFGVRIEDTTLTLPDGVRLAVNVFRPDGYVGVRVDVRGTGRSEGVTPDREYSEQEQLDGMEVFTWIARQPWCDGNAGMWGVSWGGFNSLQMAARQPPALKAILAMHATEDLFQDSGSGGRRRTVHPLP